MFIIFEQAVNRRQVYMPTKKMNQKERAANHLAFGFTGCPIRSNSFWVWFCTARVR